MTKFSIVCGLSMIFVGAAFAADKPGQESPRKGDEIMVCGRLFHTTTPVVLWTDPGGFDAYRVEKRFAPFADSNWQAIKEKVKNPARYGMRTARLKPEQIETIRGGGWDLPTLQNVVDQFVIHFDARGTAKTCYEILHDVRGLSVHFMLDLDGTIYQTLDLKEAAWHATIANGRSIGIEIANVGAYPVGGKNPYALWYKKGPDGRVEINIPGDPARKTMREPSVVLRPDRPELIRGNVQGTELDQYDLTPQQYESLIKLTATLTSIFPKIKCDYPKDEAGKLIPRKLTEDQYRAYQGILGHYHVQLNKVDPGPAFQWDRVIEGARKLNAAK